MARRLGGAPSSLNDHHAKQQQRLAQYEHHLRNEIVGREAAIRHHELMAPHYEVLSRSSVLNPIQIDERIARMDLERLATVSLSNATRGTRKLLVEAQIAQSPSAESEERDELVEDEATQRHAMIKNNMGLASRKRLLEVEEVEKKWRLQLLLELTRERNALLQQIIQQRFVWLVSPSGTCSEVNYRRFLEVKERMWRDVLAIEFCKLNWMWCEEWRRMTLMFLRKFQMEWLRGRMLIGRQEQVEWEEIQIISAPVFQDVKEQVAFRAERQERRQRKIEALKRLRYIEVERLAARRRQADSYVQEWKVRELQAIDEIHKELLQEVATFGHDEKIFHDMVEHQNTMTDLLSQPTTSFAELKNYRLKLLGFDRLVSTVEADVTPALEMRTKPLAIEDKRTLSLLAYHQDRELPDGSAQKLMLLEDRSAALRSGSPQPHNPSSPPPRSAFEGYRRWEATSRAIEKSQSKDRHQEHSASRHSEHRRSPSFGETHQLVLKAVDRSAASEERKQLDAAATSSVGRGQESFSGGDDEFSRRQRRAALQRETSRLAATLYQDPELDKLQSWLTTII